MATINLASEFNIDNFWNSSAFNFISNDGTEYRFQNNGGFVKVTGTGLTDSGGTPTGGNYTDITVYSDAGFTTVVGTYHSTTNVDFATFFSSGAGTALASIDTITGSSGNDTIIRFGGGDMLDGGDGSDIYNFFSSEVSGTTVNDTGSGSDNDILRPFGSVDFTTATSIAGIEALILAGFPNNITFNASQFGPGLISNNFAVTSFVSGDPKTITINNASDFSLAGWTFTNWQTINIIEVNGTTGADTLTGSSQADTINAGDGSDLINGFVGADNIDGGSGTDTITLSGTSSDLSGASNAQIVNVEQIDASGAAAGVTIALSNQSEGFTVTGSSQADSITGGAGSDIIVGFVGTDSVDGGSGIDFIHLSGTSADLNGASDVQIVNVERVSALSAATIDLSSQSEGFTINGSSQADTVTGGNGNDTIAGSGGGDTLDGGDGGDTYQFLSTSDATGVQINDTGSAGDTDFLQLPFALSIDFTGATSIAGIEALTFTAAGDSGATFNASQFGTGLISNSLAVTGTGFATQIQSIVINNASNFSAAAWTFTNWEATDSIVINGAIGADTITGSSQADTIDAGAGSDLINGFSGTDSVDGGDGFDQIAITATSTDLNGASDAQIVNVEEIDASGASTGVTINLSSQNDGFTITGSSQSDIITGGAGNDTFRIAGNSGIGDTYVGGDGTDTLQVTGGGAATLAGFDAGTTGLEQWAGNGQGLFGTGAANVFNFAGLTSKTGLPFVNGGGGNDNITGSTFADTLLGALGNDTLRGGTGNDVLTGGSGRDIMFGDAGNDDFDFNSKSETKKGSQRDQILDFSHSDDIDLRTIDAETGGGNQKFTWIGKQGFHHEKGELRYIDKGASCIVQGDVNGDGKADFEIFVKIGSLAKGDFLL